MRERPGEHMVKKTEFWYDSRDQKTKIAATQWTPDGQDAKAIVQIVHGMAEHMGRYEEFAQFLAENGMIVVASDMLGHGKTLGESGIKGYFCNQDPATVLVRDVHRLKKITQEKYKKLPYIILGHSMGSFILKDYLSRYGSGIDGAILCGSGCPSYAKQKMGSGLAKLSMIIQGDGHTNKFLQKLSFKGYNNKITAPKTEVDWLCTDKDILEAYRKDPLCGFAFTNNGYRTLGEIIRRGAQEKKKGKYAIVPRKLPILIASGKGDPVGNYGRDPQEFYDFLINIGLTRVQLKLYNEARHEILNGTDRQTVYEDMRNWILSIGGSRNE